VAALPGEERASLLVGLLEGADPHVRPEALRRFREQGVGAGGGDVPARTAEQLQEQAERLAEARAEAERERARREKARRDREDAVRRGRELDLLARQEPQAWAHVEELIATRLPRRYDEAARLLRDLRDLARRRGDAEATEARIGELVARHAPKRTLVHRVQAALASEERPGAAG
jgi:hypothetical protein